MIIPKVEWIGHSLWKIGLETELDSTVQADYGSKNMGLVAKHEK